MASLIDDWKREAEEHPRRGIVRNLHGWKFILSFGDLVPTAEDLALLDDAAIERAQEKAGFSPLTREQLVAGFEARRRAVADAPIRRVWHLSAALFPRSRSSTTKDWEFLGRIVAAVGAPKESLLTPIESTRPDEVHHWDWEE